MSNDVMDQVQRVVEWVTGLGFLLPVAIFVLVQLFGRDKADKDGEQRPGERSRPAPRESTPQPTAGERGPLPEMPWGLPTWMGMDGPRPSPTTQSAPPAPTSQWGHGFDRQETASDWGQASDWGHAYDQPFDPDDQVLKWGSAFENDAEGEPIRWASTFDEEGQQNVYGWKGVTWGGTFPPRDTEPVIHVG